MKRTLFDYFESQNKFKKLNHILYPTDKLQNYYLNDDNSSWILIQKIDFGLTNDEFNELFSQRPGEKLKIKIKGCIIKCPRYSQSYLKSYNFSGLNHEANVNLPNCIEKLLKNCQSINPDLNQVLINWYEPNGYIGKHSDDIKQLKYDSDIFSLSFGPAQRIFIMKPKYGNQREIRVHIENNTLIIMGGKCQSTHYHLVPKSNSGDRRLNVTLRCFN